ncbi:hypothetical protein [Massilia psychrophila]|uniref:Pilus assembly protein n=1 Tax=Massilia psychrophila TaxID=1603353 RepID=A0A2G8SY27_9BURK|nr:hypothetical protein [Massilia psychrophila]PIL38654.1 hypothetical protein CR103_16615 [Massilia psychrophila]GGE81559.1 hypothetical protein GCM10008020_28070 [Massilia psychrophila]
MNKSSYCAVLAALAMLAGCAATPNYDKHFGDAVRQSRAAMTVNPKASANRDPVAGLDGQAAAQAMARYQDSFKAPPPPVPLISLSSSSSSSAGAGAGEAK